MSDEEHTYSGSAVRYLLAVSEHVSGLSMRYAQLRGHVHRGEPEFVMHEIKSMRRDCRDLMKALDMAKYILGEEADERAREMVTSPLSDRPTVLNFGSGARDGATTAQAHLPSLSGSTAVER
jgi:hypothetical protein